MMEIPDNKMDENGTLKPRHNTHVERDIEMEQFKRISKSNFYKEIENRGINLEVVPSGKKGNEDFHLFNILVKDLNENILLDMMDIVLYLEEDMFEMKTAVLCFNEENLYLLREEMSKKFNIKNKNKLDRYLASYNFGG